MKINFCSSQWCTDIECEMIAMTCTQAVTQWPLAINRYLCSDQIGFNCQHFRCLFYFAFFSRSFVCWKCVNVWRIKRINGGDEFDENFKLILSPASAHVVPVWSSVFRSNRLENDEIRFLFTSLSMSLIKDYTVWYLITRNITDHIVLFEDSRAGARVLTPVVYLSMFHFSIDHQGRRIRRGLWGAVCCRHIVLTQCFQRKKLESTQVATKSVSSWQQWKYSPLQALWRRNVSWAYKLPWQTNQKTMSKAFKSNHWNPP